MNRRSPGEGSVYFDERGRWIAEVSAGYDARGRRKRVKRVGKSKSHATRLVGELRRELDAGVVHDASTVTVGDLLDRLLDVVDRRGRQPKTLENYQWAATHLRRGLGRERVRSLTPMQVEAFLEDARDRYGLGRSSLARLRLTLRLAIELMS